jgi:hypothetical protein
MVHQKLWIHWRRISAAPAPLLRRARWHSSIPTSSSSFSPTLWSRGVASRQLQMREEGGDQVELRCVGCGAHRTPFCPHQRPASLLFLPGHDPGHRPRLLLLGHGGAPDEQALVRASDL